MIQSITVIGARGRVGAAVSARFAERGLRLDGPEPDVVLLCVPDRAIEAVAREVPVGPWVGHVSGATPLRALEPHARRFSLHPLQTFSHARGAEQLNGVWGGVAGETEAALSVARELARLLGLRPFDLDDETRVLYHAGAVFASNYLVTLRRAGGTLLEAAGVPPEALEPLMRGVMETDFALTGPIDRGDWATVDRHREAIHQVAPELEPAYDALAELTASQAGAVREVPT
jgi:predicted short-subunit dehydrogenase-like oxidoreductase (DUF2520 family)